MEFLIRNKGMMIGALLGLIAGYLYWHFIGCVSGTCAITSSPINSTLFGALFGGLLGNNFNKEKTERPEANHEKSYNQLIPDRPKYPTSFIPG